MLKFGTLLWHNQQPIGICLFTSSALSLAMRNRYFGLSGKRTSLKAKALNQQIVVLSRVVIHPSYRGAGLASDFVRQSCLLSGWPWVESLARMGEINPFFEKAGFLRVGSSKSRNQSRTGHSAIYGGKKSNGQHVVVTAETHRKSQHGETTYYIWKRPEAEQCPQNQPNKVPSPSGRGPG